MRANRDLVLAKAGTIDRCLQRIQETIGGNPDALDDQDHEDIFVLNLQRAVQAAIDLAHHIVATEGLELPSTLKESFELLQKHGGLSSDLSQRMRSMVGFRNIAVHDYEALDKNVLKTILQKHLQDLRQFARYALQRAGLADS